MITDSSRLVIRSWIGGADGGYDMTKIVEHSQGIYRIDWDVDREIVLAEPVLQLPRPRRRRGSRPSRPAAGHAAAVECFLHDGYDTFGECWGWGTPVHAWSATPIRDLVWHVLGVTPAEPG